MKTKFIEFLMELMKASPDVVNKFMTDELQVYIDALCDNGDKPLITDVGRSILQAMQQSSAKSFKSKDIASTLGINSKCISGSMRKLTSDGFVDKLGQNPVIYILTEKGKNFNINEIKEKTNEEEAC